MASGGARARSGPAPDPSALRRERDAGEWTVLPVEGRPRSRSLPEWPLIDVCPREAELWARLWRKPQALMWERLGQEIEVALYVRNLALAELLGAPVNLGTLVRQMADSLGLTTPGLRANRWRISRDEVAERRGVDKAPTPKASSRSRLNVVADGGRGA